jgi:uncharacterized hydrophobic protein (TIGR00271 family)
MSILACIKKLDEVAQVVGLASRIAEARETSLTILRWIPSPPSTDTETETEDEALAEEPVVQEIMVAIEYSLSTQAQKATILEADIRVVKHSNSILAILNYVGQHETELIVVAAENPSGPTGATDDTNLLLKKSPCNTLVLFGGPTRSCKGHRTLVLTSEESLNRIGIIIAGLLAKKFLAKATIGTIADDSDDVAHEVNRREVIQLIREAGVEGDHIKTHVFPDDPSSPDLIEAAKGHDLILVGINNQEIVQQLLEATENPTIAVTKRAPAKRFWKRGLNWIPHLSPAAYADLIQGLRRGSTLNSDFLTMLGLAAAIASLGLLQDSPAVVIGSMLLAPLMTPMIGNGLALAQVNSKLGKTSARTIVWGFLLTLLISFLIGMITPGNEITQQITSRGSPTILDLFVALFSAAAAAFALAQPNIVGAIAGVAIATALVPPLCVVGIALAYQDFTIAHGAALLFLTNLVAIILGAAATFRFLGVKSTQGTTKGRPWAYQTISILGLAVIVFAFPLERALERSIELGKPQPRSYPLPKVVNDALAEYTERLPDVEFMASGRYSSIHTKTDIAIFLTSPRALPQSYAKDLIEIVHREMDNKDLKVKVHALWEAWEEEK